MSAIAMACCVMSASPCHAEVLQVTDLKGRAIEIELLSLVGDTVNFRRAGNSKEFSLPVSSFAESSQTLIRKSASLIPVPPPKIDTEVVIGKRRSKGDSYYLMKQEITCKIKLKNPNFTPIPPMTGKILFIGQDRRTPDLLKVISTQSVECDIAAGKTFEREMKGFTTTYDSDNKGVGNVGGIQYMGYVLVMVDAAQNVVLDHTTTGSFRQAITTKPALLKEMLSYSVGAILTEKLQISPLH